MWTPGARVNGCVPEATYVCAPVIHQNAQKRHESAHAEKYFRGRRVLLMNVS